MRDRVFRMFPDTINMGLKLIAEMLYLQVVTFRYSKYLSALILEAGFEGGYVGVFIDTAAKEEEIVSVCKNLEYFFSYFLV